MEKVIKYIAFLIFCIFWIPIGLFVWISMLLRITLVFVSVCIAATISSSGTSPSFEDKFASASMFFVRGFTLSYAALFHGHATNYPVFSWKGFFAQLFLTVFFYGTMYLFYELKVLGVQETWHRITHVGSLFSSEQ